MSSQDIPAREHLHQQTRLDLREPLPSHQEHMVAPPVSTTLGVGVLVLLQPLLDQIHVYMQWAQDLPMIMLMNRIESRDPIAHQRTPVLRMSSTKKISWYTKKIFWYTLRSCSLSRHEEFRREPAPSGSRSRHPFVNYSRSNHFPQYTRPTGSYMTRSGRSISHLNV